MFRDFEFLAFDARIVRYPYFASFCRFELDIRPLQLESLTDTQTCIQQQDRNVVERLLQRREINRLLIVS